MFEHGTPYVTEFPDREYPIPNIEGIELTVVDILELEERNELDALSKNAKAEIAGGVDDLPIQIFMGDQPGPGVFVVIGKSDQVLIGYGYAHTENSKNPDILYINTIFVKDGIRRRKVAAGILGKLINEARRVSPGGYKSLKAVVHPENTAAIEFVRKHSFAIHESSSKELSKSDQERILEKSKKFRR